MWKRAMITRFITICFCLIPAATSTDGERLNSVVNNANAANFFLLQFALTPLVKYNCSRAYMGSFVCKNFDVCSLYAFAFLVWFVNALALSYPGAGMLGFAWGMEGRMLPTSAKFWLITVQLVLQSFSLWWQLHCVLSPIHCPMRSLFSEREFKNGEFALHFDDADLDIYIIPSQVRRISFI